MEQFMMYKDSLLLFYQLNKKLKNQYDLISDALITYRFSTQPLNVLQENDLNCLYICLEFEKDYLNRVITEQEYINTVIDFYSNVSRFETVRHDETRKRKREFN
ncbi:unknown [Gryllus bimaculatus nudivirus]|uniref:Uncharacterized protein n=1 Tax=Gryllus bimaculatus nudivirus TaxID=432587 RepID=A4L1Z3_9VIRU|nr:hypothetical protein GrBNV_gp30 [Gryllus bimaculatus nudivirus]ABO45363.1 unknown [Gryllus bimaculatus nudivirus]